jgi:hypothetical protein
LLAVAAEPPAPAPPHAEFGIWDVSTNGVAVLKSTRIVPLELGVMYGWRLQLTNKAAAVRVKQILTLPAPPQTWDTNADVRVSANRKVATVERMQEPVRGWIAEIIRVADGDPEGKHTLQIFVDDQPVTNFQFETRLDPATERPVPLRDRP